MNTKGLTNKEVLESRKIYGSNTLSKIKKESLFELFLESLSDPIIRILLIALGIKIVFLIKDFDIFETVGILIAIFISSFISTISEYGSEKAFIKMQEESEKIKCKVKRNNKIVEIPIDEIVKNDIVLLEQGDKVPADGVLIDGSISVDESALTGESKEKNKNKCINKQEEENTLYRGSIVTDKKGLMIVSKVGKDTIYGKLNDELLSSSPDSPLKLRLKDLALTISKIGYIGAFLVTISFLFSKIVILNNYDIDLIIETLTNYPLMMNYLIYALTLAVTIIVVAVPEGLPMMITLVLSRNMKKMIKENVLVRKLTGIETAGNINILFTDKTGTLTKGQFEITKITLGNLNSFSDKEDIKKYKNYYDILSETIIYNSDCYLDNDNIIGGNTTDKVLFSFFNKEIDSKIKKINIKHFNSKDKYSKTLIDKFGKIELIKGAKEVIIPKCKYFYNENGTIEEIKDFKKINNYIEELEKE